jgi:hypothetical protein
MKSSNQLREPQFAGAIGLFVGRDRTQGKTRTFREDSIENLKNRVTFPILSGTPKFIFSPFRIS